MLSGLMFSLFFFFNDTATTEIYTLSLHDALPISGLTSDSRSGDPRLRSHLFFRNVPGLWACTDPACPDVPRPAVEDRKSTRLNSSHANISYAVFCLQKKKNTTVHSATCFIL